jgi:predicted DNA-binding protein (MmcQ/YjbR family)
MNHRHWNTVRIDGELPDAKIEWLIRHSYDCVAAGLPRSAFGETKLIDRERGIG